MATIYGQNVVMAGSSGEPYAYIYVLYKPGAICSCTDQQTGKVYYAKNDSGEAIFGVDKSGTYKVTVNNQGTVKESSLSITQQYKVYEVNLGNPDWYDSVKDQSIGTSIIIDSLEFIIVDKSSTTAVLGLSRMTELSSYNNPGATKTYSGSVLATRASNFESTVLSAETKEFLNQVNIDGYIAKAFVPTRDQFNGGFSYYNSDARRQCVYVPNSAPTFYWTSTYYSGTYSICVSSNGQLGTDNGSNNLGFRPHIEVNLTL